MRIGFIGVGNMGAPMARNLSAKGHDVAAFDMNEGSLRQLAAGGIAAMSSIADLSASRDAIITMLPSGKEVRAAYLGESGAIAQAAKGTLLIDCSTTDVETARMIAKVARETGLAFLDAPVSGGVAGASAGTLTFMVGGQTEDVERARTLLEAMGRNIVHVGPAGAGQAVKICNNLILGISMIGVCEAFVLAEKLGLPADRLFAVSANSSGQCWSLTSYCPVPGLVPAAPSNRDYTGGFSGGMMLKDLRLASDAANGAGLNLSMAETAKRLYERYVQEGRGIEDFSGIIRDLSRW